MAQAVIQELLIRETTHLFSLLCRTRLESRYKNGFRTIGLNEMSPYFQRISRAEWIIIRMCGLKNSYRSCD
jgi:hypothetical protein